jgi:SAM-dependent methyltransferase
VVAERAFVRYQHRMDPASRLSDPALAALRQVLLGADGDAFIRQMVALQGAGVAEELDALRAARSIGLVEPDRPALTAHGWLTADSLREYRFWRERGGRLHAQGQRECLSLAFYTGKSVLEPGSGFGCNLLSLGRTHGRFVGVEPVALYRQLTPLLAEREGLPVPEVVDGSGEHLPFADAEFDVVLCYSAHQYMDVRPALLEMARVLRRGGQLQIVGGVLSIAGMVRGWLQSRELGMIKRDTLTIANTWAYAVVGHRLYVPRGGASTSAPVYPSVRRMGQWMRDAGLALRTDLSGPLQHDRCFIADKSRA